MHGSKKRRSDSFDLGLSDDERQCKRIVRFALVDPLPTRVFPSRMTHLDDEWTSSYAQTFPDESTIISSIETENQCVCFGMVRSEPFPNFIE